MTAFNRPFAPRTAAPGGPQRTAQGGHTTRATAGHAVRGPDPDDPQHQQTCPYPGCVNGYIQAGYSGPNGIDSDHDNDADDMCQMCHGTGTVTVIT